MSPLLIDDWQNAVGPAHTSILVHLLVQHDPLFDGSALRDVRIQPELQKAKSLPSEVLDAWRDASQYPKVEAKLCLLRVHALFPGDTFSKQRFDAALPLAKKILIERAPK